MDTRSKILSLEAAGALDGPLTVATGYFNPLLAEHALHLARVRVNGNGARLLVGVLPVEPELLPQRARAELLAALGVVDYVVAAGSGDLDELIAALHPAHVERLEAADAQRTRELIDHAHRRQIR